MATINRRGLDAEIAQKGYKIFKNLVRERVDRVFRKQNDAILAAFESNPITREIEAGPTASNSSGVLGGIGNLFSFIGFEAGADPISPLRKLLTNSIKVVSFRKKSNKLALRLVFTVPTREEIEAAAPLPWAGNDSWVTGIERGLSGLGRYLYAKDESTFRSSRSGSAIEAKVEFRNPTTSAPAEYIGQMLEEMMSRLEASLKRL